MLEAEESPQPITEPPTLRRSNRIRKPTSHYTFYTHHYDWLDNANSADFDLAYACATEAILSHPIKGGNVDSWEPAP
jgi:hypothetical protein